MPEFQLDSTDSIVEIGDGLAISAPGLSGRVVVEDGSRAPGGRRMRGGGATSPETPELDQALRGTNTQVRQTIALQVAATPAPAGTRSLRAPRGDDALLLEAPDPGPDNEQIVLAVDEAGAMSWHFPEHDATPQTRGAGRRQRFLIPSSVAPPPERARATRGLVSAAGRKVLKLLVYPKTDPIIGAVGEAFAAAWEAKNRPYRVRRFGPDDYTNAAGPTIGPADWRQLSTGPALLFIHGTFSTAHGAFGALPRYLIAELNTAYEGRVFAFNHPTLSEDPESNARRLIASIPDGTSLEVDIVCHSRGGLVARSLAALAGSTPNPKIRVRKIVFVGAPNAGTALAEPDHMVQMIDRYTSVLNLFPTGPITETLEAIITAVKVIGHAGLKGLSGLASMNPTGEFLRDRLGSSAATAPFTFAIAADYRPTAGPMASLVTRRVADATLDRVFEKAANDLVVPTKGAHEWGGDPTKNEAGTVVPEDRRLVFDSRDGVTHTTYFGRAETVSKLREWLASPVAAAKVPAPPADTTADKLAPPPRRRLESMTRGIPTEESFSPPAPPSPRKMRGGTVSPGGATSVNAPAAAGASSAPDEGTDITRYPSIRAQSPMSRDADVDIVVDLGRQIDTATIGEAVKATAAADWRELHITVRVTAPGVQFDNGGEGTIVVRRNQDSIPCTIRGHVDTSTDLNEIEVAAVFFNKGRFSGVARRVFPVEGQAQTSSSVSASKADNAAKDAVSFSPDDIPPALTVTIMLAGLDNEGHQQLQWHLSTRTKGIPRLPKSMTEKCSIGRPDDVIEDILNQFTTVAVGTHLSRFEGVGSLLWERAPECFKKTYWALLDAYGPGFEIQFISEDPNIPWELMYASDEDREDGGLLVLNHPIARWSLAYEGIMPRTLPAKGDIVTIAPDYQRRSDVDPLPSAAEEARMLQTLYSARRIDPADRASVLALFQQPTGPVSILHFAGHGKFDSGASSKIVLSDDELLSTDVRGPKSKLGRSSRPLVVFNACEVGRQGALLGTMGGWAETFIGTQFGGFLAPLWPVYDEDAHVAMEQFFEGVVQHRRPVAKVLHEIRRTYAAESPTFLSYLFYGDVMAQRV